MCWKNFKLTLAIFCYGINFHFCKVMVKSNEILNLIGLNARLSTVLENIHLLCKGKYQCTTDLLFGWLEFNQTSR